MKKINLIPLALLFTAVVGCADQKMVTSTAAVSEKPIVKVMRDYDKKYRDAEYFSGMSVAVSLPGQKTESYYLGNVSHRPGSGRIDGNTLFNIGSITKSFTAAIILRSGIDLDETTIGNSLPQYPKWGPVTMRQMLNMTSGLPNYSNSPTMNHELAVDLGKKWTEEALIDIVYPPGDLNPPRTVGYAYTNTGYLLAGMIAEKKNGKPFVEQLDQLIQKAGLKDTFIPNDSASIVDRMAHGYSFNPEDNPELLGKDVSKNNLSWAAAAGGLVATTTDIIEWVRALFEGDVLSDSEKKQLESIVSLNTGKPIVGGHTTQNDPKGFGLGVSQFTIPGIGEFWFYEGSTIGFRAIYMYVPATDIVIAVNLNSAVYAENDHVGELMQNLYKATIQNLPGK